MAETDWLGIWRELSIMMLAGNKSREGIEKYQARVRRKAEERPDPLLDLVRQNVANQDTVIDIGAGSGRWTIPLARVARKVTALEPSGEMRELLRHNIADSGQDNIRVVLARWEEVDVEPHDIIVCAHAMYGSPDFASFVGKMGRQARKGCYLALRLPPHDGVIGELSRIIHGHPHDSPNAIVASHALYALGVYVNLLVEEGIKHWVNSTLAEAFDRAKRHLRVASVTSYDELIRETLERRLKYVNGAYLWPDGMRSALLWWRPSSVAE